MSESKKAYQHLWKSENADQIDTGAMAFFDEFYKIFLEGEWFRERDFTDLTVVDLGAGRGSRLAQLLENRGAKLIAVDWMYDDPDFAMRYQAERIAGDVLKSGLDDEVADIVISANVMIESSYFAKLETKKRYVAEILRLLKKGGIFWGEEKDLPSEILQEYEGIEEYNHFSEYYIHYFKKS